MKRKPVKNFSGRLVDKIATIGCLEELSGFTKAGIEIRHVYSVEEKRALDEKRAELMRKAKR